jgi:hypothetical protein
MSSGIYRHVVRLLSTDVSDKHVTSIFRVALLATCFMLVSCLAYSPNLKMVVTCSSEMYVDLQWTIQCYIPEDRTLHNDWSETLKSYANCSRKILLEKVTVVRLLKAFPDMQIEVKTEFCDHKGPSDAHHLTQSKEFF